MKKLLFILIALQSFYLSASYFTVQWSNGSCPNISCCSGDTIFFENGFSGTGFTHQQLFVNTTPLYDSMTTQNINFLYVVLPQDTTYDLIYNSMHCKGKINISCNNGIGEKIMLQQISINPNPTSQSLNIISPQNFTQLKIIDVFGNDISPVFLPPPIEKNILIDVSGFKDGVYFISLLVNGQRSVQKLIIQH